MNSPADSNARMGSPVIRVRPDSWLVGAFLVLVGVAVSAAAPQILNAVRAAVSDATNAAAGPREAVQRPLARVAFVSVRLVAPTGADGGEALSTAPVTRIFAAPADAVFAAVIDLAARIEERGFSARAPPSHAA